MYLIPEWAERSGFPGDSFYGSLTLTGWFSRALSRDWLQTSQRWLKRENKKVRTKHERGKHFFFVCFLWHSYFWYITVIYLIRKHGSDRETSLWSTDADCRIHPTFKTVSSPNTIVSTTLCGLITKQKIVVVFDENLVTLSLTSFRSVFPGLSSWARRLGGKMQIK